MNQKLIIESLAMDLKRVAIGSHRGSIGMTERFKQEALTRASELQIVKQDKYLEKLIIEMRKRLKSNNERLADDALMLSVLFQNFALHRL